MGCCNSNISIPAHSMMPKTMHTSSNQCMFYLYGKCCMQQNDSDGHSVSTWIVNINGDHHIVCAVHVILPYFDEHERYQL
jgi:hypothetical protein